EQDKKQKKSQVIMDEQWKEQKKVNQALAQRLPPIETQTKIHQSQIETIFDIHRMDAHRELEIVQGAVERTEQAFAQAREALRGEQ
ncbi:MAG: hypothetical protein KKC18_08735, partial [Chloroflexi bacterium]|nr:hypothetical protein [Chloroflexota bacterium]